MHAVLPLLVDEPVVLVLGLQAAARGAEHHPCPLGQRAADLEPRLGHRLAGGEEGELGEAVVEGQLLPAEVRLGVVAADLAADGDREPLDVGKLERRRCPSGPRRIAAIVSLGGAAEGVDRALAGDDDPPATYFAAAIRLLDGARRSSRRC